MSPSRPQDRRQPPDLSNGLPVNLEAEGFVLSSILVDSSKNLPGIRALPLEADDFWLPKHQRIYRRALELDDRGIRVNSVTLAEELERYGERKGVGGLDYLNSLDTCIVDPVSYARVVKEKSVRRRLVFLGDSVATGALSRADTNEKLITFAVESLRKLQAENGHAPEAPPAVPQWPDPLHEDAFHGVAGELVRLLEPHSEADPAALLLQFLAAFGSMIGRGPYYLVEADYHHTNIYVVIVGASSKGRKGTAWGRIRSVLGAVDEHWTENCIIRGLGSGEGLIDAIGGEGADKRCLVQEAELARLLAIVSREGTTLSAVIRDAYDTGLLSIKTRQDKVAVKGAHVSLVAHISRDELRRRLNDTELANGFANRMLWTCAARSKELPEGGGSPDLAPVIRRISRATEFARKMGFTRVYMDQAARALWRDTYHDLSAARPGLLGDVTNRMEANTIRTSLNYALLDGSEEICEEHLRAGLAVVSKYCYDSARFIWGDALGDPTADEALRALRAAGAAGLSRLEIQNHFGRNKPAAELDRAIGALVEHGLMRSTTEHSGGRPVTRYWAV
jgi:hypothetical protein